MTPYCATGIFPAWIPASEAMPDSCRCVIVSDGEGCWIGCWTETWHEEGYRWEDALTEEPFDSVITHWMEMPEPPVI